MISHSTNQGPLICFYLFISNNVLNFLEYILSDPFHKCLKYKNVTMETCTKTVPDVTEHKGLM